METIQQRRDRLDKENSDAKARSERINKLRSSIRSDITEHGIRAVELQLEWFKSSENVKVSVPNLSKDEVIECYDYVINKHKNR